MPSQDHYYRDPYHHSRTGSGGSFSAQYTTQSQYPSPVDSNSSRGRHLSDIEMTDARAQPRSSSRPRRQSVSVATPFSQEIQPEFSTFQSSKHPNLHFLLAVDSARANGFVLDIRKNPRDSVAQDVYENYAGIWVTKDRPLHVRIISRDFPWVIDIKAGEASEGGEHGVSCGDVWYRLHKELLEPIRDSDWAHLNDLSAHDRTADARREYLISIARHQNRRGEPIVLRRYDWLMRKTLFTGLEKDDGLRFCSRRTLPGKESCTETWIADFSDRV